MGLLDWLTDGGASSSVFGGMGGVNSPSGVDPNQQPPMPPVQMTGTDALPIARPPQPNPGAMAPPVNPASTDIGGGIPPGGTGSPPVPDPSTTDIAGGMQGAAPPAPPPPNPAADGNPAAGFGGASMPPPPVPMPQPRPAGAPGAPPPGPAAIPPNATPTAGAAPPGPPMNIAPQAAPPTAPAMPPGQTALGRALGIRPDQAALNGRQSMAGFGAGLKAIGQGAGLGQGKFAAFAGGAGNAMEGANKEAQTQQKQATDYLKSAIDAKKAGDEAGYKQNYLQYLAATLKQKTDAAANKDAVANKNDTPTQLYLSAQRLVQPDRNALNKQLDQMRKDGTDPALLAKTQADGEAAIQAKLQGHYSTLGIHPQDAATLAKQPGNSQQNPVDGKVQGLTPDNIAKKLQPGQWFTNPADGKLIQYKGPPKSDDKKSNATPDKPTNPEPIDPTKPYKTPASAMASADDED